MGKRGVRLHDRRTNRHIKVNDAAEVIAGLEAHAALCASGLLIQDDQDQVLPMIHTMLEMWYRSPVALRVDAEFAGALINSDDDDELVADWLTRMPFDAVAYSFPTPISLHDGIGLCHYYGMVVTGIRSRLTASDKLWTTFHPIPVADGVRCLWYYQDDGDSTPKIQTVTFLLKNNLVIGTDAEPLTIGRLIAAQSENLRERGRSLGEELPVLMPLSLTLLLYTAQSDPEITWPPPEQIVRPHQIRDARIGDLGWRIGAALRQYRKQGAGDGPNQPGLGGWQMPPHIRKAHWTRVRIATRDGSGRIIGNVHGVEGVDWHYENRWLPPTPVNADQGAAPVVREVYR